MWTSQLVNREDLFDPKRTNKKGKRTERGAYKILYNIGLPHQHPTDSVRRSVQT